MSSSILDTAEFQKLALIAAGVDPADVPSILDTATWRHLMLAALQGGKINSLSDVGDVLLTDPETGQVLTFYNGTWINQNPQAELSAKYLPTSEFFFSGQPSRNIPEFTINLTTGFSYILNLSLVMECNDTDSNLFIEVQDIDGQQLFDNSSPRFNVVSNNIYISLLAPTGPAKIYNYYALIEVKESANATEAIEFFGKVGAPYDGAGGQLGSTSYLTFQKCNF